AAQGKEAVNRARRAEGDARTRALKDARPAFIQAGTQLKDAAKLLDDQRKALGEPQSPDQKSLLRDLTQSWLLAQLEEGINLYQHAQTFGADERDRAELKERATLLTEAAKAFERLSNQDLKQPLCWLGRAWLARCYSENDDYPKATDQFDTIKAER